MHGHAHKCLHTGQIACTWGNASCSCFQKALAKQQELRQAERKGRIRAERAMAATMWSGGAINALDAKYPALSHQLGGEHLTAREHGCLSTQDDTEKVSGDADKSVAGHIGYAQPEQALRNPPVQPHFAMVCQAIGLVKSIFSQR